MRSVYIEYSNGKYLLFKFNISRYCCHPLLPLDKVFVPIFSMVGRGGVNISATNLYPQHQLTNITEI